MMIPFTKRFLKHFLTISSEGCSKNQYLSEKLLTEEDLVESTPKKMKPKHKHLIKLMEFPIPSSPAILPSSSQSSSSSPRNTSSSQHSDSNLPVEFHFRKRKSLGINNQMKETSYLQVIRYALAECNQ